MTDIGLKVACIFSKPGKHVVNVPRRIIRIVYFMLIHSNDHWKKMMTKCIKSTLWEPLNPDYRCSLCGDDHHRFKPTVYQRCSSKSKGLVPKKHNGKISIDWIPCVKGRIDIGELEYLDSLSKKLVFDLLSLATTSAGADNEYIMKLCANNGIIFDEEALPEDGGCYTNNYKELIVKLMKI